MYVIVVLPVKFSFVEETYVKWEIFDYFMDICFGIDIVLNFFTCYYDSHENLVLSHK